MPKLTEQKLRQWLFNPFNNIDVGLECARYNLETANGDLKRALTFHNMGHRGTRKYVGKTGYYEKYIQWLKKNGAKL